VAVSALAPPWDSPVPVDAGPGPEAVLIRARRLVADREFLPAALLLAHHLERPAPGAAVAAMETTRALCVSCADHLRLANDLATAARDHEAAAQEIRERLDQVLSPFVVQPADGAPAAPPHASAAEPAGRDADVAVAVLGPLEVSVRGERIAHWGSQKSRTAFQYLVLHRDRPVRREVLMELLWPGHSPTSARNNLNVCLYGLRHTLHAERARDQHVLYRDGCYLLSSQLTWWVDRDEFLSQLRRAQAEARAGRDELAIDGYQRAIALYRGPLLEDDANDDWFAAEQRSLHELHLQALDGLAGLHLRNRDVEAARDAAQRALRQDAGRESAHRLLMRCYSHQQQKGLVVRQFRQCAAALQDDLGVSPTEETVRLFRELTASA